VSIGVFGVSVSVSGTGIGGYVPAISGSTSGVTGISDSSSGVGVGGIAPAPSGTTYGVRGSSYSPDGYGVTGAAFADTGSPVGVWGIADSSTGLAALFSGNVNVTGMLVKGGGAFKIDHPLDPENKYLSHSFVESPDMMNVYNGNIVLDNNGEAWVQLPEWFEALNKDFRYQLTAIGAPGPNLHIAQTVQDNKFKIAGGQAGMTVSWQVTGIRHDPFADAHRIQVEEYKSPEEQGKYLAPTEWGQPEELGVDYQRQQQLLEQVDVQHYENEEE
jgi:hypothetical protein